MQDAIARSELHSLHSSGDLPHINNAPTGPISNEPAGPEQTTGTLKGEPPREERSLRYDSVPHFLKSTISFLKGGCTMQ